eukprot:11106642-Alexandrium_andersonii.AAC.2
MPRTQPRIKYRKSKHHASTTLCGCGAPAGPFRRRNRYLSELRSSRTAGINVQAIPAPARSLPRSPSRSFGLF